MLRFHWLHGLAAIWLILGGAAGIGLILYGRLVPTTAGDCSPYPQCYAPGHPYAWLGVLILIVALGGAFTLSRVGTTLKEIRGRTAD